MSVCPSVKRVHCDKMEERSVQIFIPHKRQFSLDFWEEERWVGATPSTWNFGLTGPRWSEIADLKEPIYRSIGHTYELLGVIQRCIKTHLYPIAFIRMCNFCHCISVFIFFIFLFYFHCILCHISIVCMYVWYVYKRSIKSINQSYLLVAPQP